MDHRNRFHPTPFPQKKKKRDFQGDDEMFLDFKGLIRL